MKNSEAIKLNEDWNHRQDLDIDELQKQYMALQKRLEVTEKNLNLALNQIKRINRYLTNGKFETI